MQQSVTYSRIVVKAGTALLTYGTDSPNRELMSDLVDQMAQLHRDGVKVILVSSGAVAAGRDVLGKGTDTSVQFRQALAAVGQSHLMHMYQDLFGQHGITVAQVLLTLNDVGERRTRGQKLRDLNVRNTLASLLDLGVVPIINENDVVAVDELAGAGFGDNDNLSARVARAADAELLVMLGTVNGLYTGDPTVVLDATLIPTITRFDRQIRAYAGAPRDQKGRGGMATKMEAAALATEGGVDVFIASGLEPDVLTRLAHGAQLGTFCPASQDAKESRKGWLKKNVTKSGWVVVDNGAADVLLQKNRSLLPVGVTKVVGNFQRGDSIQIRNERGIRIAAGIANYSSIELEQIKGLRSDRIAERLGDHYGDEVVHRREMIRL
jgi:glutamate 5-kinase